MVGNWLRTPGLVGKNRQGGSIPLLPSKFMQYERGRSLKAKASACDAE
jgi:hypothetical protein